MRRQLAFTISALLLAAPSFAQITVSSPARTEGRPMPALLSSLASAPGDSGLVRAAKATVAARMRTKGGTAVLIDNAFVQSSRGSLSGPSASSATNSGTSMPSYPLPTEERTAVTEGRGVRTGQSTQSGPDPMAEARRKQQLAQEQGRMRSEAEQPYGDNVNEDLVTKRLTEIPGEMVTPPPPPH